MLPYIVDNVLEKLCSRGVETDVAYERIRDLHYLMRGRVNCEQTSQKALRQVLLNVVCLQQANVGQMTI